MWVCCVLCVCCGLWAAGCGVPEVPEVGRNIYTGSCLLTYLGYNDINDNNININDDNITSLLSSPLSTLAMIASQPVSQIKIRDVTSRCASTGRPSHRHWCCCGLFGDLPSIHPSIHQPMRPLYLPTYVTTQRNATRAAGSVGWAVTLRFRSTGALRAALPSHAGQDGTVGAGG
ncbi:hypothetical protein BKA81DRAFT_369284 [Phyllosticta paracitricarpa]